ncbi:glutathione S-transferase C-terminal domain-containing protein [Pseudomonas putida]|uniref:glutathione S-transferase C-terminal domain-containing protein n=1 Tax=Pseudomonas putida TaxID=303 RepID=UPI00236356D5|nr:glutathione S-transferase C-terminal domain-containing protein [Pseudomonas putida]MDD1964744.1 glutathione S-transferase C-terminal domain-containing protein [Pseudomonas putida]
MKLYIANQTCSQAVQIIANELGLELELVHFDVFGKSTSNGDDFAQINPLLYVPALVLNNDQQDILSETIVVTSYLADQHPQAGLIPAHGTLERVKFDQLLTFIATEIAQKHIPLMRKLLTEEGTAWTRAKLVTAYSALDTRLADGRAFLTGDTFTVADAYVFGTWWHTRSGAQIEHLEHLMAYKARMDALPSVQKALKEEAALFAAHSEAIPA